MTVLIAACLALAFQITPLAKVAGFEADAVAAERAFRELQTQCDALLLAGRVDALAEFVLEEIDLPELRTGHAFGLGNHLYRLDPEASRSLHRRAYEDFPQHYSVTLEWALQQHRSGDHAAALETYELYLQRLQALNPVATDTRVTVLRADCLFALGRIDEAVATWNGADMKTHHTKVEKMLQAIHGASHPERRRSEHLAALRAGDLGHIEPLIWLDLRFDQDLWNANTHVANLERDLQTCRELLADAPERLADLELLVEAQRLVDPWSDAELQRLLQAGDEEGFALRMMELEGDDTPGSQGNNDPSTRRGALRARGYLGSDARLPEVGLVAANIFSKWIDEGTTTAGALLRRHEAELRSRCMDGDDVSAFRLLVALTEMTGGEGLAELEAFGWEHYRDLGSLASLIHREGPLAPGHPYLEGAREFGAADPRLMRACAEAVAEHPEEAAGFLVLCVRAHLAHMVWWQDIREPMAALEQALAARDGSQGAGR